MIREGSGLTRSIHMQFFGPTQNPFTLSLTSVSIDAADTLSLGIFIGSTTHEPLSRATAGKIVFQEEKSA